MNTVNLYSTLWCLFLAACFLLVSCDIFQDGDSEIIPFQEDTYTGIYSQGFEDSFFEPCIARNENWQLMIEDTTFFAKFSEVGENPVFMELKGTPSPRGEFDGFFVTFDRQFTVKEVIRVRSRTENDC